MCENLLQLADRMEYVHSDIRGPLYYEALQMQREGIDVLKLNTGNPAAFASVCPKAFDAQSREMNTEPFPTAIFRECPRHGTQS